MIASDSGSHGEVAQAARQVSLHCSADAAGAIVQVSPALLAVSGWSLAQLQGTPLALLCHPDDQRIAEALLQATALERRDGVPLQPRPLRWRTSQGQWLELGAMPGPPGRLHFQLLDPLTSADATAGAADPGESLLAAPELAWLIFEHSAIGKVIASPDDGRFLRVNEALCRLLGRDRAELMTCDWPSLTHPDDRPLDRVMLQEILDDHRDHVVREKRYLRPDGSVIHAQLSLSCIRNNNRSVRFLIGQIVDLTALHLAQHSLQQEMTQRHAALERSEQRLQRLACATAETFVVLREGCIRWLSPAIQTLGWREEQCCGQPLTMFLDPRGTLAGLSLDRGLEPGEILEWRDRIRDAAGQWHWARFTARPYNDPDRAGAAVLLSFTLIDEQRQREEQLLRELSTDDLTQLLSRRAILERLQQQMRRCRGNGCQLALLFIDLDHFKVVNDSHGHAAGDVVLQVVAQRLKAALRRGDQAGRLAGDELLVILQGVPDLESATVIAEALRRTVVAQPVVTDEVSIAPSLSIGVTLVRADESCEDLIGRADRAIYAAKRGGRNRVEAF